MYVLEARLKPFDLPLISLILISCRNNFSVLSLHMQSVSISTNVVSSNPDHAKCTTVCDKAVSDLRQMGGFLRVLWFPPPMKLTAII